MASETVNGHKRKLGEMLDDSKMQEGALESVNKAIENNDDDTEEELPRARTHRKGVLPTHPRPIIPKPSTCPTSWVAPVRGTFSPVRRPMIPALPLLTKSPIASDAGGRPYPSPYNTYPTNQTILDYEIAKAKARTPLTPSIGGPAARYTSVLEHDLAVATGRLARANYERIAGEERLAKQAREIIDLRGLVMRMEDDREDEKEEEKEKLEAFKVKVQEKMDAIAKFMMEHLATGTEVHMEMFEAPAIE